MSDPGKPKIIVDDDWKAEAEREKERLAETSSQPRGALPNASFAELVNLLAVQALAGLGMLAGPGGERMPPQIEVAKHFIDMLQMLEDKTRGNTSPEEKRLLDQVLYEVRTQYVSMASGGMPPGMV